MQFSRHFTAPVLIVHLLLLSSCGTLDEWVDPLFDDPLDQSAQQDEQNSADADGNGPVDDADSAGPLVDKAEQTLDFGPNPFYAQSGSADAATVAAFQRGIDAMRGENWSRAEGIFSDITGQNSRLSGPLLNLGIAQWRQDKLEPAQKSFEAAIKANKSNQEAYNQLALLHRSQGRFAEAKKYYQRAINVWPGYPSIRINLGILYELYLGELSNALQQYETYQNLRSEPDKKVAGWIIDLKRRIDS